MKALQKSAAIVMICLFPWSVTPAASEIPLSQLEQMFADMRANPDQEKWNVDGDLLWGYFFTDRDRSKLQSVADYLVHAGYRFVDIHSAEDNQTLFLHVEKIEHHTPLSLKARNHEFYKLARKYHLQSYDGMDVGPTGSASW